ncbi:hypothetical protein [Streptomyces varsoviensis]|nr:hypothetical protein [Streptomyces varsoviensis]
MVWEAAVLDGPADASAWETAVLRGGPADGTRIQVAGRPSVVQVVRQCPAEQDADGGDAAWRVQALYVYRRDHRGGDGGFPHYGFDPASP